MSKTNGWPGKPGVPLSDEIRAKIKAAAKALCHYPSGPSAANSCCSGIGRCEMKAAIAEITHLRAELATARKDALEEAARAMIEKYQSTIIRPNTPEAWRFAILQDLQEMAGEKPKIITAADIDALAKGEGDE
jgi:hypothetical protein